MAMQKIGEVKTPSANVGQTHVVFWDKDSGKVYVASEYAGNASSESEAIHIADYYASTKLKKS